MRRRYFTPNDTELNIKLAGLAVILLFLMGCIIFSCAGMFGYGPTDAPAAIRTLESAGCTDIEITGYRPWQGDDFYSTGFEATNAKGERVSGAVTQGLWGKSNTIRWD